MEQNYAAICIGSLKPRAGRHCTDRQEDRYNAVVNNNLAPG